ncbi:polar amino acid transport system permease protein [Variovorax boronicumulans]|uniref:Polar amino acid transport system permease protein n=1 Tax=Variovorax boronicumulans TaxID=436515 RepID=A0AAW8DT93_9BURK|nr:amino acid ABC transporter permease [Variovorax boronicumulans]MDP9877498.1 polar amino acid transport system permease protein [Variovorax boronicumulans]MDP9920908.1 polar amino acid transport system permease protein [Variovorax boronicumulans]MDP9922783.1 polar amino acid transport system permease protein [Variovorax boronicumulans]
MNTVPASSASAALPVRRVVHRRQWGAWCFGAVVVLALAWLVTAAVGSKVIDVGVFASYVFSRNVLIGAGHSVMLGTIALLLAVAVGLVVAMMRVSGNPILVGFAASYVYLFRGTPMLIQLIFWFNAFPIMFPQLHLVVPFTGLVLLDLPMTQVITPYAAALAGLSLAEGAYMAEIIRGGFIAVDNGQRDAARSIGMTHGMIMRKVVIPQAARIIVPATGNQYIMLLKSTSLASAIGYLELLRISTDIYAANFRVVELLAVAGFWYLVMTAFATALQTSLEKRFPHR